MAEAGGESIETSAVGGILRTFAETTTIKGLPKLVKSRSIFQSGLWFLALVGGSSIASRQLYSILIVYFDFDTLAAQSTSFDTAPFPDVTVCNLNPTWTDDFVKRELNQSIADTNFETALSAATPEKVEMLRSLLDSRRILQSLNHTKLMNDPNSNPFISCTLTSLIGTIREDECLHSIQAVLTPEFGPCFTYSHSDKHRLPVVKFSATLYLNDNQKTSMISVKSQTAQAYGARVLIHPRSTFPHMTSGVNISPGKEVTIRTKYSKIYHLGEPYSSCQDQPDRDQYKYTFRLCIDICFQRFLVRRCGCLHMESASLDSQKSSASFCGKINFSEPFQVLEQLECARNAMRAFTRQIPNCKCSLTCSREEYAVDMFHAPWPHESYYLSFYNNIIRNSSFREPFLEFEPYLQEAMCNGTTDRLLNWLRETRLISRNFIQINVEVEDNSTKIVKYTPKVLASNLVGNVGGILNLWVGFSFVTLVEMIDTLYLMLNAATQRKDRKPRTHPKIRTGPFFLRTDLH